MKKTYKKCEILIQEILDIDVITASSTDSDPSTTPPEHDNGYIDYSAFSFILQGKN